MSKNVEHGYTYKVEWSEEDGEYVGTVEESPEVGWMIPRLKRWLASGGVQKNASKIPANKRIKPLV